MQDDASRLHLGLGQRICSVVDVGPGLGGAVLLLAIYTVWTYSAGVGVCRTVSASSVAECYARGGGGGGVAAAAAADVPVASLASSVLKYHVGTLLAAAALAPVSAVLRAAASPFLTPRQMLAWCAPATAGRRHPVREADVRSSPGPSTHDRRR